MSEDTPSDLWWLPNSADWRQLLLDLGHHQPLHEADDRGGTRWIWTEGLAPEFVPKWRTEHRNTNIYRRFVVALPNGESLFGPILLDIDHEKEVGGPHGYVNDLEVSHQIACKVADRLEAEIVSEDHVRVFFSGRKGFHFEIRPAVLGVSGVLQEQINAGGAWEYGFRKSIAIPEHASIDRIFSGPFGIHYQAKMSHSSIRMHDSINCWIDANRVLVGSRKVRLTFRELRTMSVQDIRRRADVAVGQFGD